MKTDPGLEPTRKVRKEISREHGNDPKKLGEYYMEYQRRFSDRLRWARGKDHKSDRAAGLDEPAVDATRQR